MDKVIFWDFDGTLVHANKRFVNAWDFALKEQGIELEIKELDEYLKSVYPWLNYDVSYENETEKWWDNFLKALMPFYQKHAICKEKYQKINEIYQERITKHNDYVLYEDASFTLCECVKKGYKNYLLSNNFPELLHFIKEFEIDIYFTDFIVSSHIGYEKPRAEIFAYAKAKANAKSGIMVGDNPIADIIGAKNAGLKTVFVHKDIVSQADYHFSSLKEILNIL